MYEKTPIHKLPSNLIEISTEEKSELSRALNLGSSEQVIGVIEAKNRRHFRAGKATEIKERGSLVVRVIVEQGDAQVNVIREITINNEYRPLPEELITKLGSIAIAEQRKGNYLYCVCFV